MMLYLLPAFVGLLLLGLLLSGGGGGGGLPVPPPAAEEDVQQYQYIANKLGINWEVPFVVEMMLAAREQKGDLSEYNYLLHTLNCCKLREDLYSEHESTDDEGNVTGSYWRLDETNYYFGAVEIFNYFHLSLDENNVDTFMNTIESITSRECKLTIEVEMDNNVILETYYDFTEEELENILKLLEEGYFTQLYGNEFGGGDLYPEDLEGIGNVAPNGMPIPLYYQYSGGWENVPFGGGTIRSSGCSVTSMGMVFTYLKGQTILPNHIVSWTGNRYYVHPAGQSWSIFPACSGQWGLQCQNLGKNSNAVVNALSNGKPVIVSMGPGTFTRAGHFIVLRGVTSTGKILVNDPNDSASKNFVNREFDLNLIMRESKNFWSFSR